MQLTCLTLRHPNGVAYSTGELLNTLMVFTNLLTDEWMNGQPENTDRDLHRPVCCAGGIKKAF